MAVDQVIGTFDGTLVCRVGAPLSASSDADDLDVRDVAMSSQTGILIRLYCLRSLISLQALCKSSLETRCMDDVLRVVEDFVAS